MAAYTPTTYVNGQAPAINATDLNHLTAELVLQAADPAINTSTFLTPTYWVNGSTHAVSDPTGLNEMERIIALVAAHFSLSYTATTWQTGWVPARNATRLNNMEIQTQTNRTQLDAPPPGQVPTAPTGLVVTPGDHQLTLTWAANPVGDNVDAYQVYENDLWFDNTWLTRPVSPRSYVMTTDHLGSALQPGQTYSVRVGAHNSAGYGPFGAAVTGVPTGTPPPPSNRYTDIKFAAGKYYGEGIRSVLEAYGSDPRLNQVEGFQDSINYDSLGMTQDQTQRVYLFHPTSRGLPANPTGSAWASWQEIRTTDTPWGPDSGREILAKASINVDRPGDDSGDRTFGPGGFSFGAIRWFACDILFPFNINTGVSANGTTIVSFERAGGDFNTLLDIHDSGGTNADPGGSEIRPTGQSANVYLSYFQTPDNRGGVGVPYFHDDYFQLWDSGGNRVAGAFNVWHELLMGIKFAADNSGWYEVWFNGVQKVVHLNRQIVTSGEGGPYLQIQNYTRYPTSYIGGAQRSGLVYGGIRCGLTRSDVQTR